MPCLPLSRVHGDVGPTPDVTRSCDALGEVAAHGAWDGSIRAEDEARWIDCVPTAQRQWLSDDVRGVICVPLDTSRGVQEALADRAAGRCVQEHEGRPGADADDRGAPRRSERLGRPRTPAAPGSRCPTGVKRRDRT